HLVANLPLYAQSSATKKAARGGFFQNHNLRYGLGEHRTSDASQLVDDAHDLGAVTCLIVIPHVQNHTAAIHDGGLSVDDTRVTGAHEVRGNHFRRVHVIDLLLQVGIQGRLAQEVVDFLDAGFALQVQVQDRHGHVRGRYADGVAG